MICESCKMEVDQVYEVGPLRMCEGCCVAHDDEIAEIDFQERLDVERDAEIDYDDDDEPYDSELEEAFWEAFEKDD